MWHGFISWKEALIMLKCTAEELYEKCRSGLLRVYDTSIPARYYPPDMWVKKRRESVYLDWHIDINPGEEIEPLGFLPQVKDWSPLPPVKWLMDPAEQFREAMREAMGMSVKEFLEENNGYLKNVEVLKNAFGVLAIDVLTGRLLFTRNSLISWNELWLSILKERRSNHTTHLNGIEKPAYECNINTLKKPIYEFGANNCISIRQLFDKIKEFSAAVYEVKGKYNLPNDHECYYTGVHIPVYFFYNIKRKATDEHINQEPYCLAIFINGFLSIKDLELYVDFTMTNIQNRMENIGELTELAKKGELDFDINQFISDSLTEAVLMSKDGLTMEFLPNPAEDIIEVPPVGTFLQVIGNKAWFPKYPLDSQNLTQNQRIEIFRKANEIASQNLVDYKLSPEIYEPGFEPKHLPDFKLINKANLLNQLAFRGSDIREQLSKKPNSAIVVSKEKHDLPGTWEITALGDMKKNNQKKLRLLLEIIDSLSEIVEYDLKKDLLVYRGILKRIPAVAYAKEHYQKFTDKRARMRKRLTALPLNIEDKYSLKLPKPPTNLSEYQKAPEKFFNDLDDNLNGILNTIKLKIKKKLPTHSTRSDKKSISQQKTSSHQNMPAQATPRFTSKK